MNYKKGRKGTAWIRWCGVLCLMAMVVFGKRSLTENIAQTREESWIERLQKEVLYHSMGVLSPSLQWAWRQSESLPTKEQELLLLLQKEQTTYQQKQEQGQSEESWEEEPQNGQQEKEPEYETWSPEDWEEWNQEIIEWDADLLKEIERENEMLLSTPVETPLSLPYKEEQLSDRNFLLSAIYNVNKSTIATKELLDTKTLLGMDMMLEDPDSGGPKVLIHHTHATEYFADSDETKEATLIVGVGDYLEELLEERYGIEVIHDRTVYPYNEAYSQALKHVEKILEDNPTIEVFIDLHRDAGGSKSYTVNIDGKETAHLMFFNGLSQTRDGVIQYLPNENQQENLAFSLQMKMAGDSLYPGLCKRNYLKAYRYNLHVLPRAVIVEVGDHKNTLQEAKNAMEPLAQILWYVLTGGV